MGEIEIVEAARQQLGELAELLGYLMLVSVVHANEGALRFYEREGFGPFYITLLDAGDR